MKLGAKEPVEETLKEGNLDTASPESDDQYSVEVKSSEDPSKEGRKGYLFDTDSRNIDSSPTEINDDGFWPFTESDDPKSAEVKMVEEKAEYLEVPELLSCYKENHELNIKDICVDENMPSCEKILFKTDTDKEDFCSFLLAEKNSMTEFKTDVSAPDHHSIVETDFVEVDNSDKTIDVVQEAGVQVPEEISDDICKEDIQETVNKESDKPCRPLPSSTETGADNISNRYHGNNFQSMVSDSDNLHLFREQHGYGESSFSMVGPMSDLITYSGPIIHSGRSDASSASTRSFAFPVLYPEWQSSPVRLPKADRRNLRKHNWWRHGLLCCRF